MDRQQSISILVQDIATARFELERMPEMQSVTDNIDSVNDYDQVLDTNMSVNYAVGLDFVYRTRDEFDLESRHSALDLCSGPGHFSICLNQFLGYQQVLGIDVSLPMIDVARENARKQRSSAQFAFGDVGRLNEIKLNENVFDLVTFTNAAHHMSSLSQVQSILQYAERLCRPHGTLVLTDMCRLPSLSLTNRFVEIFGSGYREQNMHAMYDDFLASMKAAWSADELATAIPIGSKRKWFQAVSAHLPFYQVLIGLPVGRSNLFARDNRDWETSGLLRSPGAKSDWQITKDIYYSGLQRALN